MGFCQSTNSVKVARAALHMWEEPCISGDSGSGAVFFSGCNLRCVYCQNNEISSGKVGTEVSTQRLSDIFINLQNQKANNINLVTPSHYTKEIIEAIIKARSKGLVIPIVYNSSSYEAVYTIHSLSGYVDVYLPDCKYYDDALAVKYSNAPGYHEISLKAIDEMLSQTGGAVFDEEGIIKKGVIVRHLILPGCIKDSKKLIRSLWEHFGNNIYYSIMNQYTPMKGIGEKYPELDRKVRNREYDEVLDYALDLGIENGFMQEGDVASESFIPKFDLTGV